MKQLLTDTWALDLPPEWSATHEDDCVVISDEDNISTIEISAIRKQKGSVTADEIASFASELNEMELPRHEAALGDFDGFIYEYDEDEYWCRDWFVAFKDVCVFVSYTCLLEDKHFDGTTVDMILESLSYLPIDFDPSNPDQGE